MRSESNAPACMHSDCVVWTTRLQVVQRWNPPSCRATGLRQAEQVSAGPVRPCLLDTGMGGSARGRAAGTSAAGRQVASGIVGKPNVTATSAAASMPAEAAAAAAASTPRGAPSVTEVAGARLHVRARGRCVAAAGIPSRRRNSSSSLSGDPVRAPVEDPVLLKIPYARLIALLLNQFGRG